MKCFRGALVKEAEIERGPKTIISKVSLGTAGIDVSRDENFGLVMERNINVSNKSLLRQWLIWGCTRLCVWECPVQKGYWKSTMKRFRQDGEYTPQLQITWLSAQRNRDSESHDLTHLWQSKFKQTIGCFCAINNLATFLKIYWFQAQCQKGETKMRKFVQLVFVGHKPT